MTLESFLKHILLIFVINLIKSNIIYKFDSKFIIYNYEQLR